MENRILIIEDEVIVAIDLLELLEHEGYKVMVAHNYKEAIKAIKSFNPHLAICDINLGSRESGIDWAREANMMNSRLEIIYVTAFSDQDLVDEAHSTEPFNFIVKPWNEQQIIVTVKMAFKYILDQKTENLQLKSLSMTEYKILSLISKQKKSKEIAEILFVSEKTVRNHRYNIIKKLDLPNENNSLLKWAITHFK